MILPSIAIDLSRTKTRDGGREEIVNLIGRSVDALGAWLEVARIEQGSVFRGIEQSGNLPRRAIDPQTVNATVKQRTAIAGLAPEAFSALGLLSGHLTEAAGCGVPLPEAMEQSRHRSVHQAPSYDNGASRRSGPTAHML